MSIAEVIGRRGITEVLHFTTNRGLLGVLDSCALKSKNALQDASRLEHILMQNAPIRKDTDWLGFVNLSISGINGTFFDISANRWHRLEDIWWCVLSFSPDILTHENVHFATTNNIYYSTVTRATGANGLEALFKDGVRTWNGHANHLLRRPPSLPPSYPTCEQAEVLYPGEVSTRYLQRIYARTDEESDEIASHISVTGHRPIDLVVDEEVFKRRPW